MTSKIDGQFFFGKFLLDQGVIDARALKEAVAFQEESNKRLGAMAMDRGAMTEEQVRLVIEEQRRLDQPFGAIALRKGFLTREALDDLLFAQTVHTAHLGEALLMKGFISPAEFKRQLKEFSNQERSRRDRLNALFSESPQRSLYQALVVSLERVFLRFAGAPVKVESLGEPVTPGPRDIRFDLIASAGEDKEIRCLLFLSESLALAVAEEFFPASSPQTARDLFEACQDFLDILACYFRQSLDEQGFGQRTCTIERAPETEAGPRTYTEQTIGLTAPAGDLKAWILIRTPLGA